MGHKRNIFLFSNNLLLEILPVFLIVLFSSACVETVTDTRYEVPKGEITLILNKPLSSDSIAMGRNPISYAAEDVQDGEGLTAIELIVNIAGRDAQSMEIFTITDNPSTTPIYIDTDLITNKFGIDPFQFPGQISYWLVAYSGTDDIDPKSTDVQSPVYVDRSPVAPTNLKLRKDDDKVFNLVWDDNSSNEEYFELWRKDGTTGVWFKYKEFLANTISYTDHVGSTVISYFYFVRAVNSHGPSANSNEAASGLNSPSQLAATALGASTIQLTWLDNSNDEFGFFVYRKDPQTGIFLQIANLQPNTQEYFDIDLEPATSYTYRIATFAASAISDFSNEATAVTFTVDIPGPSFLTADFDADQRVVIVNWKDNTDDENGTEIERKEGLTGTYHGIGFTNEDENTFYDDDLEENKVYYYRARHTTTEGFKTPYSNVDSAYVPPLAPKPPSDLQIFTFTQNLVYGLFWTDNSDDEDGFELTRTSIATGASFTFTFSANITAYNDTLPDPSKEYTYKVRSYKGDLHSVYSNEVSTMDDELTAPTGLTATQVPNENIVDLEWIDNSNNELGFIIERRKSNEVNFTIIKYVGPDTEFYKDLSGLTSDTEYIYRVKAYNGYSQSDYSNTASVEIGSSSGNDLAPPTNLTAAQLTNQSVVDLQWTDNSNNELGFIIEKKTSTDTGFLTIQYVGPNTISYRDLSGVQDGITYNYRVKAYNGFVESNYSNIATVDIVLP